MTPEQTMNCVLRFVGVGVIVLVGVTVCVGVFDGVFVGVDVCVGVGHGRKEYVKSFGGQSITQTTQLGSNSWYLCFNNLKLWATSEASNGSVYILKALISPMKLPPNISSNFISVVNPE